MPTQPIPLILASASPRRRELLSEVGLRFEAVAARISERRLEGEPADRYVTRMAAEKREAVAREIAPAGEPRAVLAADTAVVVDGEPLGKPSDDGEALFMLRLLRGRSHDVLTAISVAVSGADASASRLVRTEVRFRDADDECLRRYVATGEGRDKAGSYGIQGIAKGLVRSIEGSYTNVVGLPVVETLEILGDVGALSEWP